MPPQVVSRDEWRAAREALLAMEKQATRARRHHNRYDATAAAS